MSDETRGRTMDNFDRFVWMMFGAAVGVGITAWCGWPTGVGWLIGYGVVGSIFYGAISGRIVFRRRPEA